MIDDTKPFYSDHDNLPPEFLESRKCLACGKTAIDETKHLQDEEGYLRWQRFRIICECGRKTKWYKTPRITNMSWKAKNASPRK